MERILEDSPRPTPRTIAVVYLLYFLIAPFALFLTKGLIVLSDPVTTANNIIAHQSLYRAAISAGLIGNIVYLALTALFYGLFRPVNRSVSLFAAFSSLVGCTVQIFAAILQLAPPALLADTQLASAYTVAQLQTAAVLSLKLYVQTFHISFVLFSLFDFLIGYLIYKSTFLPRFIGVLWMIAGLVWLTYLWPPAASSIRYLVLPVGGLPELILMVWLFVKGVDVARWREKAGRAPPAEYSHAWHSEL